MAPQPSGPVLDDSEVLYRAILYVQHWDSSKSRASSAAFDDPVFSVDRACKSTPGETRKRFRSVLRLVEFQSGAAKNCGFDPRDELDPNQPNNPAHAHVYFPKYNELGAKKRKGHARRLAEHCTIVP